MEEQIRLIAAILNKLCKEVYLPYPEGFVSGVDVGICPYCMAHGEIFNVFSIKHNHKDDCVIILNAQLQSLLQNER